MGVQTANAPEVAKGLQHYGGLFIGDGCAEVVGDYGAGPNHTLPTGGTARSSGGLSVFTFLRIRTYANRSSRSFWRCLRGFAQGCLDTGPDGGAHWARTSCRDEASGSCGKEEEA